MNKPRLILWGILALILIWGGLTIRSGYLNVQEARRAAQADVLARQGAAREAQGRVYDAQSNGFQAQVKQDDAKTPARDAEVARLRAEVARLRKPAADTPAPNAQPVGTPLDLAPLVAKQDELIKSLDAQHQDDLDRIKDRDALIGSLTLARDSYHASSDAFKAQAVQEHAARVAAEGLAKSDRWRGRLEGAGAVGAGYAVLKVLSKGIL